MVVVVVVVEEERLDVGWEVAVMIPVAEAGVEVLEATHAPGGHLVVGAVGASVMAEAVVRVVEG